MRTTSGSPVNLLLAAPVFDPSLEAHDLQKTCIQIFVLDRTCVHPLDSKSSLSHDPSCPLVNRYPAAHAQISNPNEILASRSREWGSWVGVGLLDLSH